METVTTAAHNFAETDVSTPLQSLSLLQSLNTVNELVDVRAPQVHELKTINTYALYLSKILLYQWLIFN